MNSFPAPEQSHKLTEVAMRLGISPRSLYREIARGHFPRPVKIGRSSRVLESDIDAYFAKLKRERGTLP